MKKSERRPQGLMLAGGSVAWSLARLVISCLLVICAGFGSGDQHAANQAQHKVPSLLLQPPVLVFKNTPVCIPAVALVDVANRSPEKDLHLLAITSQHPQFYPAMFKAQVLAPYGRTSIQIIFLPRAVGAIETTLTISTKQDDVTYDIPYRIRASPTHNLYRLTPIVGTKVPAGMPNLRPIVLYNPHDEVLHVREVFTTEAFLNIITPEVEDSYHEGGGGENRSGLGVWTIPPKQEKEIVKLSFRVVTPGKYQGYVHLKTDVENLVLPIELNVVKGGVYALPKEVDFGVLASASDRREVTVTLRNSAASFIALLDASPSMADSLLSIDYPQGRVIAPGGEESIVLAYSGRAPGRATGKVVFMTNHSNAGLATVEVDYRAHVVRGGLAYRREDVQLPLGMAVQQPLTRLPNVSWPPTHSGPQRGKASVPQQQAKELVRHDVKLSNAYPVPLSLQSVTMRDCGGGVSVSRFMPGAVAWPQAAWPPVELELQPQVALQFHPLPRVCSLVVSTNATHHVIPVYVYHGRLHATAVGDPSRSDGGAICFVGPPTEVEAALSVDSVTPTVQRLTLDFGVMGTNQTRTLYLALSNRNPVPISFAGPQLRGTSAHNTTTTGAGLAYGFVAQQPLPGGDEPLSDGNPGWISRQGNQIISPSVPKPVDWEGFGGSAARRSCTNAKGRGGRSCGDDDDWDSDSGDRRRRKKRRSRGRAETEGGEGGGGGGGVVHTKVVPKTLPAYLMIRRSNSTGKGGASYRLSPKRVRFRVAHDPSAGAVAPTTALRRAARSAEGGRHMYVKDPSSRLWGRAGGIWGAGRQVVEVIKGLGTKGEVWRIDEGHTGVISVTLTTPPTIDDDMMDLRIEGLSFSTAVEAIELGVKVRVSSGEVRFGGGRVLDMGSCLLGQSVQASVYASNLMVGPVTLRGLRSSEPLLKGELVTRELQPNTEDMQVGQVTWNSTRLCADAMSGGQSLWSCVAAWLEGRGERQAARAVLLTAKHTPPLHSVSFVDTEAHRRVRQAWADAVGRGLNRIKAEMTLDTSAMETTGLQARVDIAVPRVLVAEIMPRAPLAYVGQVAGGFVAVTNPDGTKPIEARLLVGQSDVGTLLWAQRADKDDNLWWKGISPGLFKPDEKAAAEDGAFWILLPKAADEASGGTCTELRSSSWTWPWQKKSRGPCVEQGSVTKDVTPFMIGREAMRPVTVAPGSTALLGPIVFRPPVAMNYTLPVYVWNSLTGIEELKIVGQAGQANLRIEDGDGAFLGGTSLAASAVVLPPKPLHFDVQAADNRKGILAQSMGRLRLRNEGDLPLEVLGLSIGGERCGGRSSGFTITNCPDSTHVASEPLYWLQPQATIDLHLRYISPCVATRESHTLEVLTSAGMASASLVAYTPTDLLVWCENMRATGGLSSFWNIMRSVMSALAIALAIWSGLDAMRKAQKIRGRAAAARYLEEAAMSPVPHLSNPPQAASPAWPKPDHVPSETDRPREWASMDVAAEPVATGAGLGTTGRDSPMYVASDADSVSSWGTRGGQRLSPAASSEGLVTRRIEVEEEKRGGGVDDEDVSVGDESEGGGSRGSAGQASNEGGSRGQDSVHAVREEKTNKKTRARKGKAAAGSGGGGLSNVGATLVAPEGEGRPKPPSRRSEPASPGGPVPSTEHPHPSSSVPQPSQRVTKGSRTQPMPVPPPQPLQRRSLSRGSPVRGRSSASSHRDDGRPAHTAASHTISSPSTQGRGPRHLPPPPGLGLSAIPSPLSITTSAAPMSSGGAGPTYAGVLQQQLQHGEGHAWSPADSPSNGFLLSPMSSHRSPPFLSNPGSPPLRLAPGPPRLNLSPRLGGWSGDMSGLLGLESLSSRFEEPHAANELLNKASQQTAAAMIAAVVDEEDLDGGARGGFDMDMPPSASSPSPCSSPYGAAIKPPSWPPTLSNPPPMSRQGSGLAQGPWGPAFGNEASSTPGVSRASPPLLAGLSAYGPASNAPASSTAQTSTAATAAPSSSSSSLFASPFHTSSSLFSSPSFFARQQSDPSSISTFHPSSPSYLPSTGPLGIPSSASQQRGSLLNPALSPAMGGSPRVGFLPPPPGLGLDDDGFTAPPAGVTAAAGGQDRQYGYQKAAAASVTADQMGPTVLDARELERSWLSREKDVKKTKEVSGSCE